MGGRGSSSTSSGEGRYSGGGGVKPGDILDTRDMVSERGAKTAEVDAVLTVSRSMFNRYGESVSQFLIADLKPSSQAIAYYDGENIAMNSRFMDMAKLDLAYKACVDMGFHPSNGSKSAAEAVCAHEFGHQLTDAVGRELGIIGIDSAATAIVNEARKSTSHRGVVQMASKISRYATASNAETIAEAVSDVYCNGSKAKKESQAIVKVIDKYLLKR